MPAHPIWPRWLLRQADELAYRGGGPGRPRPANLRRAVSAAYYALFHTVTLEAAHMLLAGSTVEEQLVLTRSINHGAVRHVCEVAIGTQSLRRQLTR